MKHRALSCITHIIALVLLYLAGISCTGPKYRIDVFMMMNTTWDQKLYSDFRRGMVLDSRYKFVFHNTITDPVEQVNEIAKRIKRGTDCIVVNPGDCNLATPVVEKAYDAGIKVVLVGQKLQTDKYTSYVGMDNKKLGTVAAELVAEYLPEGGNIISIRAESDNAFARDRHESFQKVIDKIDEIRIVASFDAAFSEGLAHIGMDSVKTALGDTPVDLIFAFGDDMAIGARHAGHYPDAIYVGIDGILDNGLNAVKSGELDATFLNPTGGDIAINTATAILGGVRYEKNRILDPYLITKDNVDLASDSFGLNASLMEEIELLDEGFTNALEHIETLKCISIILLVAFLITAATVGLLKRSKRASARTQHALEIKRITEDIERLRIEEEVYNKTLSDVKNENLIMLEGISSPEQGQAVSNKEDILAENDFMLKFKALIKEKMSDPELSIEVLANDMGLSKAQLYRKVRSEFDSTPNELLQEMRLSESHDKLLHTDLSVSEIAYSVGFSSPSYFTKCYKEKYGILPSSNKC